MMPSNRLTKNDLRRIRDSLGQKVNAGTLPMDEASRIYDKFNFSAGLPTQNPFGKEIVSGGAVVQGRCVLDQGRGN